MAITLPKPSSSCAGGNGPGVCLPRSHRALVFGTYETSWQLHQSLRPQPQRPGVSLEHTFGNLHGSHRVPQRLLRSESRKRSLSAALDQAWQNKQDTNPSRSLGLQTSTATKAPATQPLRLQGQAVYPAVLERLAKDPPQLWLDWWDELPSEQGTQLSSSTKHYLQLR